MKKYQIIKTKKGYGFKLLGATRSILTSMYKPCLIPDSLCWCLRQKDSTELYIHADSGRVERKITFGKLMGELQ